MDYVVHVFRLRFLVRMFRTAPFLLTLLDASLLRRASWVRALAESFDWLNAVLGPDAVPGIGGLDDWIQALQLDPPGSERA